MKETTVKQAIERAREVEEQGIQIQIENVSMTFKDNDGNDVQALKNINLNVKKGEFVSLVGPSGCGKTTLLRLIADLLEPSDGIVKEAGMTPREVRLQQKFGIVFQKPVLFDWRTVKKNVEMPLEIMKWRPEERSARAEKMLEMVGLTEFENHYPGQLSGGMQQRVGIARAPAAWWSTAAPIWRKCPPHCWRSATKTSFR